MTAMTQTKPQTGEAKDALKALLAPRSIAILGASSDFRKVSGRPVKHLLDKGYKGRIYPVNPRADMIGPLKAYPNVAAIDDEIDLAIIVLPASEVLNCVRELGSKGVPVAVIFSSGFAELGDDGRPEGPRRDDLRGVPPWCGAWSQAFDARSQSHPVG